MNEGDRHHFHCGNRTIESIVAREGHLPAWHSGSPHLCGQGLTQQRIVGTGH